VELALTVDEPDDHVAVDLEVDFTRRRRRRLVPHLRGLEVAGTSLYSAARVVRISRSRVR